MTHLAFTDCETTGLHDTRRPWDIAIINHECANDDYRRVLRPVSRYQIFVHPEDLDWLNASSVALDVGGFWQRHPHAPLLREALGDDAPVYQLEEHPILRKLPRLSSVRRLDHIAADVYRLTSDRALIAGSNPHFDMHTLGRAIEAIGLTPGWHYHPYDVPSVIEGFLYGRARDTMPPAERKSEAFCTALGLDVSTYARHTAMGDCELFYDAWKLVVGA